MEGNESLEKVLDKIKGIPSISDAVLMTKTGMVVLGSLQKTVSLEKFAGMVAILMGSAEATSLSMNEDVKGVVIGTKKSKIAITGFMEDLLLAVTMRGRQDYNNVLNELDQITAVK